MRFTYDPDRLEDLLGSQPVIGQCYRVESRTPYMLKPDTQLFQFMGFGKQGVPVLVHVSLVAEYEAADDKEAWLEQRSQPSHIEAASSAGCPD